MKDTQSTQNKKELSYTQKCLIFANLSKDKKKVLINSFDNIPVVKLYTANIKQDNFIYSKIRGGLCFLFEKENKEINYFLQIYDIHTNTLAFNVKITQKMVTDIMKLENYFMCFPTKYHFFGFKFNSKESFDKFFKILKCDTEEDLKKYDINIKSRDFKCPYKDILKVAKNDVKSDFLKKIKAIDNSSGGGKIEKDKIKMSSFQLINELSYLLNSIEYDDKSNKFNIFIDKNFNPKIIKAYIDIYKNSKKKTELNIRIIFDDYTHIYSKNIYIELLINNLMNNNIEAKKLTVFKREHQKRHHKEDFEESKRINSEYIVSKSYSSTPQPIKDNNDKIRNSAVVPSSNNFNNNVLKRTGNITENKNSKSIKSQNIIKEVPEEDIDHLKNFNNKQKNTTNKKK